jgi:hypothetical protein
VRVCTRAPNKGKTYNFCSPDITDGDPGPANISIPGSILSQFEVSMVYLSLDNDALQLVIEARHFNYDAFGVQGGVVIIDDVSYFAPAVVNCRNGQFLLASTYRRSSLQLLIRQRLLRSTLNCATRFNAHSIEVKRCYM